jgi:hypothetical protein
LGREAMLNDPCVNDDDETMKPARSNALYSSVVKTPCDIAEEVPMRFKISRNFSIKVLIVVSSNHHNTEY